MRPFLLAVAAVAAFTTTMMYQPSDANAYVCARGVYRAGCAGPNGAVVVRRPYYPGRGVYVRPYNAGRGVYVRRY